MKEVAALAVADSPAAIAGTPLYAGADLSSWPILTATAGLIAFHIGLFTLVGRERKSPYTINLIFPIFLLCLGIAAVATFSAILPDAYGRWGLRLATLLLVIAFVWSAFILFRVAVRFVYFVEKIQLKDLWPFRTAFLFWHYRSHEPNYSHDPHPIPADLKDAVLNILAESQGSVFQLRDGLDPLSVAVATEHQGQSSELFARLAHAFFKKGFTVQYLTASRHPIEFLSHLDQHLSSSGESLKQHREKIVVIDAYSSHFAFLDSIYHRKNLEVAKIGVTLIPSGATYAGMHSASSRAFKTIKKQVQKRDREPTLVIYEDCHALADLESVEQYRIFIRHVMPSERMWGGMFTVFSESAQPDADWNILQSYASMRLDYRAAHRLNKPQSPQ